MAISSQQARRLIAKLNADDGSGNDGSGDDAAAGNIGELLAGLARPTAGSAPDFGPSLGDYGYSAESQEARLGILREQSPADLQALSHPQPPSDPEVLRGNIENFIGMTQVPTGVIGPVGINGTAARGGFYVPLATTEGALVASFNRGARATRDAGGITAACLTEAVQRAPSFKFRDLSEAGRFLTWVLTQRERFGAIVSETSRYAELLDVRVNLEGNQVILVFEYHTGDAAGQNMVTVCTYAICQYILESTPVAPAVYFVESNYSGDKKATAVSFSRVRGKKVTAEVHLPEAVITGVLNTTAEKMTEYARVAANGTAQTGALGLQGHFANGLAALYLACGQDVACVAESYVGITRMEPLPQNGLYVSVTLPSLTVGTVGGGTRLPTQATCLELIGCKGPGTARKFAEICGATVLCGEISIVAALSSGEFTQAHAALGRR